MPATVAAFVVVAAALFDQGLATLNPMPLPTASRISERPADTAAPARMADQDTAELGAGSFSTMTVSIIGARLLFPTAVTGKGGRRCLDLAENHRQIVGWHLDHGGRAEAVAPRQDLDLLELAQAPAGVSRLEIGIERFVAGRRGDAAATVGPVEEEHAVRRQRVARAFDQADGRGPRRDMDHVDAKDRGDAADRPFSGRSIER